MIITLPMIKTVRPQTMLDIVPKGLYDQCIAAGYGWAPEQHSWYYAVSRLLKPKTILEIGVLDGFSLTAMGLGSPDCYCEGWDNECYRAGSLSEAAANLTKSGLVKFNLIKVNSRDRNTISGEFDLIHVDGDHSHRGALHDLKLALTAAKNILVDDYDSHPEVRRAVDDFLIQEATLLNVVKIPTHTGMVLIQP